MKFKLYCKLNVAALVSNWDIPVTELNKEMWVYSVNGKWVLPAAGR